MVKLILIHHMQTLNTFYSHTEELSSSLSVLVEHFWKKALIWNLRKAKNQHFTSAGRRLFTFSIFMKQFLNMCEAWFYNQERKRAGHTSGRHNHILFNHNIILINASLPSSFKNHKESFALFGVFQCLTMHLYGVFRPQKRYKAFFWVCRVLKLMFIDIFRCLKTHPLCIFRPLKFPRIKDIWK